MDRKAVIRASMMLLVAVALKHFVGVAWAQDASTQGDEPAAAATPSNQPVEHVGQASGPFSEIGDGFKQLGHEVEQSAREVGQKAKQVGTGIGHAARDSAKAVGNGATDAARGVGNATRNAVNDVEQKPQPTVPAPEPVAPAVPPEN